jgi:hypothetical protein
MTTLGILPIRGAQVTVDLPLRCEDCGGERVQRIYGVNEDALAALVVEHQRVQGVCETCDHRVTTWVMSGPYTTVER